MSPFLHRNRFSAALLGAALFLAFQGASATGLLAQASPSGPASGTADAGTVNPPPILTLDQDRLFQESAWGRAALARIEAETSALATENRRIEMALEEEERSLIERRKTLPADDFAQAASDFDAKVEQIRAAQDVKSRTITQRLETDRQQFFQAATPVLAGLLEESGAVAILADSAIILSLTAVDVTTAAVARMDEVMPAPANAPVPQPQSNP